MSLYFLEITNLVEKPCLFEEGVNFEVMILTDFNLDVIFKFGRVYIRYKYWGVQQFRGVLQELD